MSMYEGQYGYPGVLKSSYDIQPPGGVCPPEGFMALCSNQNGSLNMVAGREWIFRFNIWYPTKLKALGVSCSTPTVDGTPQLWLGIRGMLMNGWPGDILVEGVSLDTASTGSKWIYMDYPLEPGSYVACAMAAGWATTALGLRGVSGGGDVQANPTMAPNPMIFPMPLSGGIPGGGNPGMNVGFRVGPTTGFARGQHKDWSPNSNGPAVWMQGEPLFAG